MAVHKGAHPTIRTVFLVEPVVARTLVLMSRRQARLSPAAAALRAMIAAEAGGTSAPAL